MAVLFLEPGSDATYTTAFYPNITGSVTADNALAHTGLRSVKCDSTAGNAVATCNRTGLAPGTGRLSVWFYFSQLPASTVAIVTVNPAALAQFSVRITSVGVLQFFGNAAQVGANGSTLSTGQWYHFAVAWSVTSTVVNTLKLFLGASQTPDITVTNGTLAASTVSGVVAFGWQAAPGVSKVLNFDDVYLDDASTLDNPGQILVTAKKPAAGWSSGFDTIIGATPANRADNVNQRLSSDTDGYAQGPLTQIARPLSDVTTTGWTFTGGATAAAVTQEAVADDDTSYAVRAGTGTLEVLLDPLTDPVSSSNHTLTVRMTTDGTGGAEAATIALYQGATAIATSASFQPSRALVYATQTLNLTAGQADAITDYTDLRVRVVIGTSGAGEHHRVTQAYFTAPYPATTINETYLVDAPQSGDVDLTGTQVIGRMAWARCKRTTSTASASLYLDGAATTVTVPTTTGMVLALDAADRFPTGAGHAVGLGVTSDPTETVTLYECGVVLAYLAGSGTKLYLRLEDPPYLPGAGEHSTTLPVGTLNNIAATEGRLRTARGSTVYNLAYTTLAQTALQDSYLARFSSGALAAQTVSANTWTFEFAAAESDASANIQLAVSLYVWRPATLAVVGFIYDALANSGSEWALSTETGQVVTFAGSAVTAADGDTLVLEVWTDATQGAGSAYTGTFDFEGGTGIVGSQANTDAATALSTPQALTFATETAAVGTTFYLLNATTGTRPTAGEHSTALPFGIAASSAAGTANEQRFMATSPGNSQVFVSWTSLAQTFRQDAYVARWSSLPLAAQTLATNTWTFLLAPLQGNANANSFFSLSVYVWRPGTSAVAGYVFDSSQQLGSRWSLSEQGRRATFTGNAIAVAAGDLLVLELWHTALQLAAGAYSNAAYYAGFTPPVNLTATSDAASSLNTPQTLAFLTSRPAGVLGPAGYRVPVGLRDQPDF